MFAYCLNNPVVFYDDGGHKPKSLDETIDDPEDDCFFPDNCDDTGVPKYNSWQEAEQGTRDSLGSVQDVKSRTFITKSGKRIVDSYNQSLGSIAESKYGYQGLSKFINSEIERDIWIRENNIAESIEWHFYYSIHSNSIGPSGPLYQLLDNADIIIIIHK